jgi:hypothetical protein
VARDGLVPYWFFTNDRFMNFELRPEKSISYKDRNLRFRGNTSAAIAIVHQGAERCLQVLDSVYADQPFYSTGQEQLVSISNVSRIVDDPASAPPPGDVFGQEPPRSWCYFFQKADLARQLGDWDEVLRLESEASAAGYAAGFGPELIPFVEAHAQRGNWRRALEVSVQARSIVGEMEPLLCATWRRLGALPGADSQVVLLAREQFACAP